MAPRRTAIPSTVRCPKGHEGEIRANGVRPSADGLHERARFRCFPSDGSARHGWTVPRRTPTANHPDGALCPNCEHEAGRADGPAASSSFLFSVTEAARSLVLLGEGKSLRESSQKVRFAAGRFTTDAFGRRTAGRQNALAADYLDQFGPVIVRAMTPPRWPRILVLDSLPLNLLPRGATKFGHHPARRGGAVLVAAGRDRGQSRTRCWLAGLAGDETAESWWEFLGQLDDDPAPFWVVADGAKAIRNAVEARWPKAIFYPCEHHLRETALRHATDDGALAAVPAMEKAIEQAFYGEESWDALGDLIAQSVGPSGLLGWWHRTDPDARAMVVLKHRYAGYPQGNGPAERVTTAIRERIGLRRRNFGNAYRLATLIALMGIDLAEQAGEPTYARLLREHLGGRSWVLGADWEKPHDEAAWGYTSLAEMIMAAWDREAGAAAGVMASAVTDSFLRRLAVVNLFHESAGLPHLVATGRPGAVPAISVKGKRLADFPLLLAEWDAAANPQVADPGSLPASSKDSVGWVCAKGHRWKAGIHSRAARATRCRVCFRAWATPETSVAGTHPALVAEWDASNAPRSPETTKATSPTPATWKCANPAHPAYPMSPKARCGRADAGEQGCRLCRAEERNRRKAADKATRAAERAAKKSPRR